MGKNNFSPSSCSGGYESPVIQVVSVYVEGIICQSGQHEEWYEEPLEW